MDAAARKEAARKARQLAAKQAKEAKKAAQASKGSSSNDPAAPRKREKKELPPLTQEDIEKHHELDEMYRESVARKLEVKSKTDETQIAEKKLKKVWRNIFNERARQATLKRQKKDYNIQKAAYEKKINALVEARLLKMFYSSQQTGVKKTIRTLTTQEEQEVRTVRVTAAQYMHIIDALNCMREEDGPQIIFLKPGDKVVRKNFEFTTANTSSNVEKSWKIEQPKINFRSMIPDYSKAAAKPSRPRPKVTTTNPATSNLEYAFSDYLQSKNLGYSLPVEDTTSIDFSSPISTPSYSFSVDDYNTGNVSYSFSTSYDDVSYTPSPVLSSTRHSFSFDDDESSRVSKYSFTIPDETTSSYASRFSIPEDDDYKKHDKILTKEEAVQKKEEMDKIRNLLSLNFITQSEHDRRMDELSDGKWQDCDYESLLDTIIEIAEREDRKLIAAAAKVASDSPRVGAKGPKQPRGGELGSEAVGNGQATRKPRKPITGENDGSKPPGVRKGGKKLTPEEQLEKQRKAIAYEEKKAMYEKKKAAYEERKAAKERAAESARQYFEEEVAFKTSGVPAHLKSLKASYKNGIFVCGQLRKFLRLYLPRDGDYSYLSSSHFTTDDESEKENDGDKILVVRRRHKKRERRKRHLHIPSEQFLDFVSIDVAPPVTLDDVPYVMEELDYVEECYREGQTRINQLKEYLYTLSEAERRKLTYEQLELKYEQRNQPSSSDTVDTTNADESTMETESRNQLHFFTIPDKDDAGSGAGNDDVQSISNYSRDGASVMSGDDSKRVRWASGKSTKSKDDDEDEADDDEAEHDEDDGEEGDENKEDEEGGEDLDGGSDVDMEEAEEAEEEEDEDGIDYSLFD